MVDKNSGTIIVCVDTTNTSEKVLRYTCYKAKLTGFNVQILAVLETSHKNLLFGSKAIGNEKRQQLEDHLKTLTNTIHQETGIMPKVSVREGDIVTEIIRELKFTSNCKTLIFGKSKSTLSDNTVLPKVINKIGTKINVPVIIVPENLNWELLKNMI